MKKNKLKVWRVTLSIPYQYDIVAEAEDVAIEQAQEQFEFDLTEVVRGHVEPNVEAEEQGNACEICEELEDDDGRCGCTNKKQK